MPEVEDVPGADGHVGFSEGPFIKEVRTEGKGGGGWAKSRHTLVLKLSGGGCMNLRTSFMEGHP